MNRVACLVLLILLAVTFVGLLVLAVRNVRQGAQLVACTNNLKQLTMGLHNYDDVNKKLPLAIATHGLGRDPQVKVVELPIEKCASWLFEIDPYIWARMDSRFRIDINKPWDAEENRYAAEADFEISHCPANLGADRTKNSYIGILGVGRDAGWQPGDDVTRGPFGFKHHVTLADIHDGRANTMLLAETTHNNGRWIAGGFATARGLDPQGPPYLGETGQFGSHHRTQTLVGMADGSVRPITDKVSARTFEALATISGGEKNVTWP